MSSNVEGEGRGECVWFCVMVILFSFRCCLRIRGGRMEKSSGCLRRKGSVDIKGIYEFTMLGVSLGEGIVHNVWRANEEVCLHELVGEKRNERTCTVWF
jgi:hypothetical protein